MRRSLLAVVVGSLVMTTALSGESTARSGYLFIDGEPLRAPAILYMPSHFPEGGQGLSMRFGPSGAGTDFELHYTLARGELVIWESTRGSATVDEFVHGYSEDGEVPGAVTWHAGRAADTGAALIYARIGQTLVVITGSLSIDELFRVANALRPASPSSLML